MSEIPRQLFYDAHRGTSMVPDKRADEGRKEYQGDLATVRQVLLDRTKTAEERELAIEEFDRFAQGYRRRMVAWLEARSRCLSSMTTGPSNFPVARNEKRNSTADRRLNDLLQFKRQAMKAIGRKLDALATKQGGGEIGVLRTKLARAEDRHAIMKAANATIRKHKKHGRDAQIEALTGIEGISETSAIKLLEPDYSGRGGFPGYELTNSNARIKSMRQRIVELERRDERTTTSRTVHTICGQIEIEENADEDRLQLRFEEKPPEEIRKRLRREFAFIWSRRNEAWQRQLTENARAAAALFLLTIDGCGPDPETTNQGGS